MLYRFPLFQGPVLVLDLLTPGALQRRLGLLRGLSPELIGIPLRPLLPRSPILQMQSHRDALKIGYPHSLLELLRGGTSTLGIRSRREKIKCICTSYDSSFYSGARDLFRNANG